MLLDDVLSEKVPVIVVGLAFGDEGKGTTIDALARHSAPSLVTRHNGGAQAGHNIVTSDGRWHCFAQYGAGTLCGSHTLLSKHMLTDLEALHAERDVLLSKGGLRPEQLMQVDVESLVVTPMQKAVGRIREIARGKKANGSCGMGVGETVLDGEAGLSLRVGDFLVLRRAIKKLTALRDAKMEQLRTVPLDGLSRALQSDYDAAVADFERKADVEALAYRYAVLLGNGLATTAGTDCLQAVSRNGLQLLFEGAQGALLDRTRGFRPNITKSDTTAANARSLLREAGLRRPFVLGALRAYGTRHGNGPFVTEDESTRERFDDPRNSRNRWQGKFRVGWLDLPALRYGVAMQRGVDGLSLTGLDCLSGLETIKVCVGYVDARGNVTDDVGRLLRNAGDRAARRMAKCRPLYLELPGWEEDISGVRHFDDLPLAAQEYVEFLASDRGLNVPVAMVSVGPTADHKIWL